MDGPLPNGLDKKKEVEQYCGLKELFYDGQQNSYVSN